MPLLPFLFLLVSTASLFAAAPGVTDTIVFGDAASEKAHGLLATESRAITGALGAPARVSLPKEPVDYYGGDLTFDLAVDPVKQNHLTVKFWGSDVNGGQKTLLYVDGEQVGYRHLGDYEALNHGADAPSFKDRFFYYTGVLPLTATRGREKVTITLRTTGPISGYQLGGGYDGYQKKMTAPSRGYYRAYSHVSPSVAGLDAERQGAVAAPAVRPPAGEPRVREDEGERRKKFAEQLEATGSMNPNAIAAFARATVALWPDLDAATRGRALDQLVVQIDRQSANAYDPDFFAKGIYQGDWGGSFAPVASAIFELNRVVTPAQWAAWLDARITVRGEEQTRRAAWTRMLKGNFDYARTHIARITNQAMFCLHGAYRSNRALQIINPAAAEPEATAKRFLFEAAGLQPYRGNDILDADGRLVGREDPFGAHYLQITEKGLTREFTYVGIYGEVANDLIEYFELYGDDEILKKGLISANARARMRYSDFDEDGYRGMRMEGVIESRGPAYPDDIAYVQRKRALSLVRFARHMAEHPERYAGPEWAPYRQMAANIVGYAQQMLADNQSPTVRDEEEMKDYLFVKNHPPTGILLPHTNLAWYRPEELQKLKAAGFDAAALERHAWADEDNGVVSLRDGDLTMFVGLVMKANWGVNGIARIHCLTPTFDRLATVAPDVQFDWSGQWSVRPDWTNVQFMNANNPPEGPIQALAGEVLPFASQPHVRPTAPVDNPYVGYGNFYSLRYLRYLIGMNTTRAAYGNARPYALALPRNFRGDTVFDFISKKNLPVKDGAVEVGPQSTVVLRLEDDADPAPRPMTPRLAAAFPDTTGANRKEGATIRWIHAGGATGYIVKRGDSATGPWREIGRTDGANTFTDPEATTKDGAKFFYVVAGTNENGVGPDSPATAILPPSDELLAWFDKKPADPAAAPEAPRDLRGENIRRRVDLRWKTARRGATYDVLRAPAADGPFAPVATKLAATSWSDETVEFGRRYFYAVVAANRAGARGPRTDAIDFAPVDDTVPAPWRGADIGEVGTPGLDGWQDDVFWVRGSGDDVWGPKDALRLLAQPLEGDGAIVARIANQQNTDAWAKCGVMMRASDEPGAPNAFLFGTPGWGIGFQHRGETGGPTANSDGRVDLTLTPWLRLSRRGDVFTAEASPDGRTWTQIGEPATVAMPRRVQVGLAVCAHSRGAINLTRFSDVTVSK